jgi:uncharacterized membrane protein YedE/YeeE
MLLNTKQTQIGTAFLLVNLILLIVAISQSAYDFAIAWAIGLAFGFVFQRSRFCTVAAIRDVFLLRNFALAKGVLLYMSLATAFFIILYMTSLDTSLYISNELESIGVLTIVGAFIFGIGMVIAGGCAAGTLVRMGEGLVMQWWGFLGLILGILLGTWQYPLYQPYNIGLPRIFIPDYIGLLGAIILQFCIFAIIYGVFRWVEHKDQYYVHLPQSQYAATVEASNSPLSNEQAISQPSNRITKQVVSLLKFLQSKITKLIYEPWSYTTGAIVLAMITAIVFLWHQFWGISNGLAHLFAGLTNLFIGDVSNWAFFAQTANKQEMFFNYPLVPLVVAMVIGSHISSLIASEFRIRHVAHKRYIVSALLGGFLMGIGARIASGCNVSAVMSGIPSFSLHGWVFLVFMILGVLVGIKILTKYLAV